MRRRRWLNWNLDTIYRELEGRELSQALWLWTWSAVRFSGEAGRKQDKFYDTKGKKAFYSRVNRVRRILDLDLYEVKDV